MPQNTAYRVIFLFYVAEEPHPIKEIYAITSISNTNNSRSSTQKVHYRPKQDVRYPDILKFTAPFHSYVFDVEGATI